MLELIVTKIGFWKIKRLWERTNHYFRYIIRGLRIDFGNMLDDSAVLNLVRTERKSIIRWGDGETNFYFYGNTASQEINLNMVSEMRKILTEYSEDSKYILCIPSPKQLKFQRRNSLRNPWRDTASLLSSKLTSNVEFGNAFIFRTAKNETIEGISKRGEPDLRSQIHFLVEDKQRIFLVSSLSEHLVIFDPKILSRVVHIPTPRTNGLSDLDKIQSKLLDFYKIDCKKDIVIISAGILGKFLVYRLSMRGKVAIDVGGAFKKFENL